MTPPPFLLGCTLVFWGWQSLMLPVAIPMAVILEGARWVGWRWALSDKDFNRVTDLTSLSLIMVVLYLLTQESIHGLTTLLNWLPMLLFSLIVAQTYSTFGSIKLSSLFLSLRHHEAKGGMPPSPRINLSYPYIMITLVSASAGYASWFFEGMCILVVWGLGTIRPQRYQTKVWVFLLIIAGILAYLSQWGLYRLQNQIEIMIINWFEEMFWAHKDPYRQNTAIGDIGRLKQSDRIILRVDTPYPLLLREASYNLYFKTTWRTRNINFSEVISDNSDMAWMFVPKSTERETKITTSSNPPKLKGRTIEWAESRKGFEETVLISGYLHKGKGILALPHGTYQVSNLPVLTVQRNDLGTVKVENGPGLVEYIAHFGSKTPLDSPPTDYDKRLPEAEKKYLIELSNTLHLSNQSPQQVLNTVRKFFQQNFQYSLNLTEPKFKFPNSKSQQQTPLENFLRYTRSGHCEYFATATVLLLRTANIPSRYASGYAVEEYSELEDMYIVRQRHAHAWALAYINGRWQEFDTTPASWVNLEKEMATWWEPIYDLWAFLSYEFTKWRWRNQENSNDWLLWLILPLGLVLIWRLYSREKVARFQKQVTKRENTLALTGTDSAFFQIVQRLNTAGYIRQPGETLSVWLTRIQASQMSQVDIQTMLTLHQRYRFDPASISGQEQAILTASVKAWLQDFEAIAK